MKKLSSVALAGVFLIAASGMSAAQTVIVTPEQGTVVREYVKKQPLEWIALAGVELNIGSSVPETVELHTIDARYRILLGR